MPKFRERASTYDTELLRVLFNWHREASRFDGYRSMVLELLVTGDEVFINSHIDKTPESPSRGSEGMDHSPHLRGSLCSGLAIRRHVE